MKINLVILLDTLEVGEVLKMFEANRINTSKKQIKDLFESVYPTTQGSLTFSEFKNLSSSPTAKHSIQLI